MYIACMALIPEAVRCHRAQVKAASCPHQAEPKKAFSACSPPLIRQWTAQLVLALGMMVNSPLIVRLPPSVVWPLVPLMANRALEMLCLLLGFVTPLVSLPALTCLTS